MAESNAIIETPRLLLRPMRAEDAEPLLGVFSNPVVMAAFGVPPFGQPEMERWVRRNLEHQERYGYGLFTVILRETGQVIGDCGLEVMDDEGDEPEVELGYDLCSDHWGRGLATEAATGVRDYAFDTLGLRGLISLIRAGNEASRRVAEKIGMKLHSEFERGEVPYWVFAMTRESRPAPADTPPCAL